MRVIYSIYGSDSFFEEMRQSFFSLREIHPDAHVECFTTLDGADRLSDLDVKINILNVAPRETTWHDPSFKVHAIVKAAKTPFIFLDNDTYIGSSMKGAWNLLKKYDLMAVMDPISNQRQAKNMSVLSVHDNISSALSEINTGVLFVNPNENTLSCLHRWRDLLSVNIHELGDQWRMRIALAEHAIRLHTLPANFNFRLPTPQNVYGPIHILHGRHQDMPALLSRLNRETRYRSFAPTSSGLDIVPK